MPIYEYECENKNCKNKFEFFAKNTNDRPNGCPICGYDTCRRVISKVNFNLQSWLPEKRALVAEALADDDTPIDPKTIPARPFKEI
jgi:putative FmdB family regulatory protein